MGFNFISYEYIHMSGRLINREYFTKTNNYGGSFKLPHQTCSFKQYKLLRGSYKLSGSGNNPMKIGKKPPKVVLRL